ncbi:MAG: mechanosensitive ion channel family protein [Pseudomonadota bacterium]
MSEHWFSSPLVLAAIVVGCSLQLLIARRLPQGPHMLRTHAGIAFLGVLLTALDYWLRPVAPGARSTVLFEIVIVGWGILFIRVALIALFRIALPALHISMPRILHEIVFVLVCVAWGLVRLHGAGLDLGGIVTTSAAITAIIAFSMQETLGNILGGLALQLDKSVHIGDWIMVDGVRGKVVEVHWRHTAMLTPNGEIVVMPNSFLMKSKVTVISTEEYPIARRTIAFATTDSVAPQQVIGAVEKALRDAALAHVASTPLPDCVVTDFVAGTTHFAVRYWLLDQQHDASADSNVRQHIHSALRRAEVALARPCLDLRVDGAPGQVDAGAHTREQQRRIQILASLPLFAGLQPAELASVAAGLRVTPFMKDDVMTRQGAVAHWLYVLVSGEADVWFEPAGGERRFVAKLEPVAMFGEMGMMTGEPRRATVTARGDVECYRIDKASFETILHARPELAGELARIIGERHSGLDAVRAAGAGAPASAGSDDATLLSKIRHFFFLP